MISFDVHDHRFNLRAAAVCLRDDEVLLHRLEGDAIWSLPGGRVEAGEQASNAVVREMAEEIGETVQCGRLLYVVENFFVDRGQSHHEVGLYFIVDLQASSPLFATTVPCFDTEGNRKLEFRWFPLSELSAIALHPAFLRVALRERPLVFRHCVQRDRA